MLQIILIWWFFIIFVEAVTEIIVDSDFFFPIRNFMAGLSCIFSDKVYPNKKRWYQLPLMLFIICIRLFGSFSTALLRCGYCMSVWVAASVAWMLPGSPSSYTPIELPIWLPIWFMLIIDVMLKTFVLHRLSNIQHEFTVRVLKRIPFFAPPTIVDNQETIVEEDNSDDQTGNKKSSM